MIQINFKNERGSYLAVETKEADNYKRLSDLDYTFGLQEKPIFFGLLTIFDCDELVKICSFFEYQYHITTPKHTFSSLFHKHAIEQGWTFGNSTGHNKLEATTIKELIEWQNAESKNLAGKTFCILKLK